MPEFRACCVGLPYTINKITTNLIVTSVERSLAFWVERVGFTKTVEVPHGDAIGFAILHHGSVELMLQSVASLGADVAEIASGAHRAVLYVDLPDLAPIRAALEGVPLVIPERTTFYGSGELVVRDPDGNVIFFAAHVP